MYTSEIPFAVAVASSAWFLALQMGNANWAVIWSPASHPNPKKDSSLPIL